MTLGRRDCLAVWQSFGKVAHEERFERLVSKIHFLLFEIENAANSVRAESYGDLVNNSRGHSSSKTNNGSHDHHSGFVDGHHLA